jgi:transposase
VSTILGEDQYWGKIKTDRPVSQIADELGVSRAVMYKWRQSYADHGKLGFKKQAGLTTEQQEIKRLRLENKCLREEREILKKAAAYFAKELK